MRIPLRPNLAALVPAAAAAAACLFAGPQSALSSDDEEEELAPVYRPRPAHWAHQSRRYPDIGNFFKVDNILYRGSQPEGNSEFKQLRKLGIRTVLDVRARDHNEGGPARNGMVEIDAGFHAWDMTDAHTIAFLRIISDPNRHPVYLHCWRGADRTGALVAIYRVVFHGWSKSAALEEMLEGGYHFADELWMNLADYVWALDIERVCAAAGITPARSTGIGPVNPSWGFASPTRPDRRAGERVRNWMSQFTRELDNAAKLLPSKR